MNAAKTIAKFWKSYPEAELTLYRTRRVKGCTWIAEIARPDGLLISVPGYTMTKAVSEAMWLYNAR